MRKDKNINTPEKLDMVMFSYQMNYLNLLVAETNPKFMDDNTHSYLNMKLKGNLHTWKAIIAWDPKLNKNDIVMKVCTAMSHPGSNHSRMTWYSLLKTWWQPLNILSNWKYGYLNSSKQYCQIPMFLKLENVSVYDFTQYGLKNAKLWLEC